MQVAVVCEHTGNDQKQARRAGAVRDRSSWPALTCAYKYRRARTGVARCVEQVYDEMLAL